MWASSATAVLITLGAYPEDGLGDKAKSLAARTLGQRLCYFSGASSREDATAELIEILAFAAAFAADMAVWKQTSG